IDSSFGHRMLLQRKYSTRSTCLTTTTYFRGKAILPCLQRGYFEIRNVSKHLVLLLCSVVSEANVFQTGNQTENTCDSAVPDRRQEPASKTLGYRSENSREAAWSLLANSRGQPSEARETCRSSYPKRL